VLESLIRGRAAQLVEVGDHCRNPRREISGDQEKRPDSHRSPFERLSVPMGCPWTGG